MRAIAIVTGAAILGSAYARDPAPISLSSSSWLGIDGNWSTLTFELGSNSQEVDVLVSTSLSEFWAVGPGGCQAKEPHCSSARGGIYTSSESSSWASLGTWSLGLSYLGYGGNGDYGQDLISAPSTNGDTTFRMSDVLISSLNTTSFLNGLFGLGIVQGMFGNKIAESPLTQAVKDFGLIPSYSYGYTAGAHYRNAPVSLTLGGYDSSRLSKHNTEFTLDRDDSTPAVNVRGIEAVVGTGQNKPSNWNDTKLMLSTWNTSFTAKIDSTTPYLWLPDAVCDQFANAFNLTYNNTFDLYTLTDAQYNNFLSLDVFPFTFVLSSFDNSDNFGHPYNVNGIVNITVPARALTGLLQYPFMNRTIKYGDPAIPYFMLRRNGQNSTFILGRSFLQESYLITKYDDAMFSIHQAVYSNASDTSDLVPITQTANSPYPPPSVRVGTGLSRGAQAGIGIGVGALVAIIIIIVWLRRRRGQKRNCATPESFTNLRKGSASAIAPDVPKSSLQRVLAKIFPTKTTPQARTVGANDIENPFEAPNSQIYEMPAPVPPAELDGDDATSWNGDTELGSDSTQQMSAYEMARRKIDQQLQGPVPPYSPPTDGSLFPPEKAMYGSPPAIKEPLALQLSVTPPTSPDDESTNPNSMHISLPSPTSPRLDANTRSTDFPSPMTNTIQMTSPKPASHSAPSSPFLTASFSNQSDGVVDDLRRSQSSRESIPAHFPQAPAPAVQRTPIDPFNVICLGPLPDNIRFPQAQPAMELRNRSGSEDSQIGNGTLDTLGSNFTVEEEERMADQESIDYTQPQGFSDPNRPCQRRNRPDDLQPTGLRLSTGNAPHLLHSNIPRSPERIDSGAELIHVPQLAERRYSWEEER